MAKEQSKKKNSPEEQSLIDYVKKLRTLNKIDVLIPQVNVSDIIENPEEYAKTMAEVNFAKHIKSFQKAYDLGFDFGKELMED